MRKTMKISGLLWALLFTASGVDAAGLGRLSVQSALGQPLRAEIELLSVSKDELPAISARLAGADAFRQARIDRVEALGTLRFSVDQRPNGQPIIRVSSSQPIADPFLDMLIEVNWNSGRVLREYTILLDPPSEARTIQPQPIVLPEVARSVQPAPAPTPAPVAETRPVTESTKPKAPEPAPVSQTTRYGPIRSGETLRGIAGKVKHEGVSVEQMMVGLYQANQSAFYADNMNRMKRGQLLNVPNPEAIQQQASPSQAVRTVQGHAAAWHAYRRKLAEMAGEAPEVRVPEPSAGKLAARDEERVAPAAAASRDVLRLSKGEPGSAGRPDGKVMEKLHGLEEELAAKGRALQEAQDRVGQLERTVRDMEKLLQLKAEEGAKAPAPATPMAPPPPIAQAEPLPAPEAAPMAPPPPVVKPKPAPVAIPAPVQQPSSSWLSTFISNPLYIGGIVAAVLLSVLLWMMMVGSRRRQGLNKFEDSIMTGGEFKNNAGFSGAPTMSPGTAGAPTEGSMLLTDFSRLGLGAIDTHEVDPIAEAEVYMAYGRDAQAEEILKEALSKDPSRHEIALKLLEIYAARKDTLAFETVASELYAGMGGQVTPVWQRAAEMGRGIDPTNPLYRTGIDAVPAQPLGARPRPAAAAVMPAAAVAAAPFAGGMDEWQPSAAEQNNDLDFAPPEAPAVPTDDDFDIPPAAQHAAERYAPMQEEAAWEAPVAPAEASFDMDFEPTPAPVAESVSQPAAFPEDLQWDTPALATPSFADEAWPEDAQASLPSEPEPVSNYAETITASAPDAWQEPGEDLDFLAEEAPEALPDTAEMPVLDLSDIDLELEAVPVAEVMDDLDPVAEEVPQPAEDVAADFDLADDVPAPEAVAEPVVESPAEDAAQAEVADPELWEEVNTKLDLARAYLEMGDKEGAREILQEVLGEGDPQQKADADKLLAEAG